MCLIEVDININSKSPPSLAGFRPVLPLHRGYGQCARLLVLVKDSLHNQVRVREELMSPAIPSVWLDIAADNHITTACFTYREWSPGGDKSKEAAHSALNTLISQIETASGGGRRVLVMGDLNLCQEKWDSLSYPHVPLACTLRDGLASCAMDILPVAFTYFSNHKSPTGNYAKSALDHIYTSHHTGIQQWGSVDCSLSDHVPIQVTLTAHSNNISSSKSITRQNFKNFDQVAFNQALAAMPWEDLATMTDVDLQVATFEDFMIRTLDIFAPVMSMDIRPHHKYGLTKETKELMRLRNKARRRAFRKPQEPELHLEFRRLRNAVVASVRRDTCRHLERKFSNLSTPTEVWRAVNSILKPATKDELHLDISGVSLAKEDQVAHYMNGFFINKVTNLQASIPTLTKQDPLKHLKHLHPGGRSGDTFDLTTVLESIVAAAIKSLQNKNSSGPDGISTRILKGSIDVIVVPLAYIVNTSLTSGKYPSQWKSARVVPIYKKGSSSDPKNYHPVSLLNAVSKVLETVVLWQVSGHCQKNGLLPERQFGFRRGRSTTRAVACMYQDWLSWMEDGKLVGTLLFDLSAAFDCLNSTILLKKLAAYGFSAQAQKWFHCYFEGRTQSVCVGAATSEPRQVTVGVPQGSVLGPLLFIIYISDMHLWTREATIYGYADDTSASVLASTEEELRTKLSSAAGDILAFMASNELCANPAKTGLLVCRPRCPWREQTSTITVAVGEENIEESASHNLLGIRISNDMSWNEHVRCIENKIRAGISMIKRIKSKMPLANLSGVLNGLVCSHIRYGIELFGDVDPDQNKELRRLQVLLNNAARVSVGAKRKDQISIKELMARAGVGTIYQMSMQSIISTVWKTLKTEDTGIQHFWNRIGSSGPSTRSSTRGDLKLPDGRLSVKMMKSLKVKGAKDGPRSEVPYVGG